MLIEANGIKKIIIAVGVAYQALQRIGYFLNQEKYLKVFLTNGDVINQPPNNGGLIIEAGVLFDAYVLSISEAN
ncbi:MAG: hypothetical protein II080_06155 [Lachnospiraceae bacterium]|nr:hypothetical protein [Lachnospiraceae bacterium]